jgi:hypothetical protein
VSAIVYHIALCALRKSLVMNHQISSVSRGQLSIHAKRLCVAMAAVAGFVGTPAMPGGGVAMAAPVSNIAQSAAPAIGGNSSPAAATTAQTGAASVSSANGAMSYSYPIAVPPGRQGAQPSLALTYSSQSPIYGGIAAGWTLQVPMIYEDTSRGRLATHYGLAEAQQTDPR